MRNAHGWGPCPCPIWRLHTARRRPTVRGLPTSYGSIALSGSLWESLLFPRFLLAQLALVSRLSLTHPSSILDLSLTTHNDISLISLHFSVSCLRILHGLFRLILQEGIALVQYMHDLLPNSLHHRESCELLKLWTALCTIARFVQSGSLANVRNRRHIVADMV